MKRTIQERPEFGDIKSYCEFIKYYWYREELRKICKGLAIDDTGTKQDLNRNIEAYFNGTIVKKEKRCLPKKSVSEISFQSSLLECGFSFNSRFRDYFSEQTGIKNFKFTADMANAWRQVKKENNKEFTIQDMIDIYNHKSDYVKYDNSSCQWNRFLKDFCSDQENSIFINKLKAAAILWAVVRDSSNPKVYTRRIVQDNLEMVKEYCRESE